MGSSVGSESASVVIRLRTASSACKGEELNKHKREKKEKNKTKTKQKQNQNDNKEKKKKARKKQKKPLNMTCDLWHLPGNTLAVRSARIYIRFNFTFRFNSARIRGTPSFTTAKRYYQ